MTRASEQADLTKEKQSALIKENVDLLVRQGFAFVALRYLASKNAAELNFSRYNEETVVQWYEKATHPLEAWEIARQVLQNASQLFPEREGDDDPINVAEWQAREKKAFESYASLEIQNVKQDKTAIMEEKGSLPRHFIPSEVLLEMLFRECCVRQDEHGYQAEDPSLLSRMIAEKLITARLRLNRRDQDRLAIENAITAKLPEYYIDGLKALVFPTERMKAAAKDFLTEIKERLGPFLK